MLALLILHAGANGLKFLRNKKTPERMKTPFNIGLMAATALVGGLVTAPDLAEQFWLLAISDRSDSLRASARSIGSIARRD